MVDSARPHALATSLAEQPAFSIPMAILRSARLIFGPRRTFCDISRPKIRGADIVVVASSWVANVVGENYYASVGETFDASLYYQSSLEAYLRVLMLVS